MPVGFILNDNLRIDCGSGTPFCRPVFKVELNNDIYLHFLFLFQAKNEL